MEYSRGIINRNKRSGIKYPLENFFSADITGFHRSLPGYRPTPVICLNISENQVIPGETILKDESRRTGTGAFKALGGSWAIHQYLAKNPGIHTFCTATDGNHGRSVAWSSRIMGQKAIVFMPSASARSRIRFIEDEGARVVLVDGDYDQTVRTAKKYAKDKNCILVQDTSWPGYTDFPNYISAGYITMVNELYDQLETGGLKLPDIFIFQSGVGSWAAAMMLYITRTHPGPPPTFIISEPLHSDCLMESARNNSLCTTLKDQVTIMAGLNCGTPSYSAWEVISDLADAFISIPDEYSIEAMRILDACEPAIETCESGAAGLGTLLALFHDRSLKKISEILQIKKSTSFMIFNTEGNTDPSGKLMYGI